MACQEVVEAPTAVDGSGLRSRVPAANARKRRAIRPVVRDANAQGEGDKMSHKDQNEIEVLTKRTAEFQKVFRLLTHPGLRLLRGQEAETVAPCVRTQQIFGGFEKSNSTKMRN